MKVFVKLCGSIIRKNKGFTVGIFLMSVLSVATSFLGANFGASSDTTILSFLSESGTPDAVFTTEVMEESVGDEIKNVPGVTIVTPRFVYDTNMEMSGGKLLSVRIYRQEADSPFKQTVHEKSAEDAYSLSVSISNEFAEHNGIHADDTVLLDTPQGKIKASVGAVVSNPETIKCVKDEMSAYESYQFGYLYTTEEDFAEILPGKGVANQWLVYFEESLSTDEQKECMKKISGVLGSREISASFTEESDALQGIRDDLHTISVLCSFIPGIIWLISLGFNFIFIKIIIENQRKTIGLLRALGFSRKRVVLLFVAYTVLVNLPAVLLGTFLGSRILSLCLGLIASAEGILDTKVVIVPSATIFVIFMAFAIGIIAALFSAGSIAKVDPGEAYGGTFGTASEPPAWIQGMKADVFTKLSAVSTVKNRKRQIIGALCIAACVICMCVGFEGVLSIGYPIDAVFGGRYRYDLMIRNIDQKDIEKIREDVRGIETAEASSFFLADLLEEEVRVSVLHEEDVLTVLTDASGNRLTPGDGIILDEMRAKINGIRVGDTVELNETPLTVTGITREILFPVMYVSPGTAKMLGHDEENGLLLKLSGGTQIADVESEITKIRSEAYFAEFSLQKDNIRSAFRTMRTIMFIFAVIAFGIGTLLVINITIIDFNENRTRFATLKALGTPPKRLASVSLMQNLFRVTLGVLIACPLCRVCVTVLLELLSGASQQYVMVDYGKCLTLSCLIPFLYVLLGTAVAFYRIKKLDFCTYLSEVE